METNTVPRVDRAVGALIWKLAAPHGGTVDVPDTDLGDLGFTRRGVEKALARMERSGALRWERKRPGGAAVRYTTVVVDARCPLWADLEVAA
jgi:hypothetical protein